VYRLTLTTGGFLDGALPLAVSRTQPTELTAYGWGLSEADARRTVAPQTEPAFDLFAPQWAGVISLPVMEGRSLVEVEPNDAAHPQTVEAPLAISGRIGDRGDRDAFRFRLAKGQAWQFKVESRRLGYPLDAVLELFDSSGKSVARADDAGQQPDAELSFTAPAGGDYTLVVSDLYGHGGPRYFYRLTIAPQEPDFALSVAGHAYVFTPDKPLEIAVAIDRRHGFAGEIEVTVDGLPPGVTAAGVKSLATGDTAKSVKVVLSGTSPAFSGPIRITGVCSTPLSSRRAEAKLAAGAHLSELWLTVANK
ncbi:MAG: PPC domain-containing protein, partial [Candidatus Saccharimonadales bacterium]